MVEFITSPWEDTFLDFVRSINCSALVVSPYIAAKPLSQLESNVRNRETTRFRILTKIDSSSMLHGSLDVKAIENFCLSFPETQVNHLPGLHAKVYVADDHTAIITSGNLTASSLTNNFEYGIRVKDRKQVSKISQNLLEYENLGMRLTVEQLNRFSEIAENLVKTYEFVFRTPELELKEKLDQQLDDAKNKIDELRGASGDSTNKIFGRAILYILRNGPLATEAIHNQIQSLHPDLCDDSEDRVINGVHFGKLWKHHVRNAQQALKKKNRIELVDGMWKLTVN